jgi:anti-anti-sigma factor
MALPQPSQLIAALATFVTAITVGSAVARLPSRAPVQVLELQGDLDITSASRLSIALEQAGPAVVIDVTGVGFIEASVLAVLLRARRSTAVALVVEPGSQLERLLGLTRVGGVIPLRADVESARAVVEARLRASG